jgi:HAD superfamily hydrolase (TIGR01484 family)
MLKGNVKLIALDLDGTLTQHKTKVEERNRQALEALQKSYPLVMVVAGTCERVYNQLNRFPVDIIGNYGLQESTIVRCGGEEQLRILRDARIEIDRVEVTRRIEELRRLTPYKDYVGDTVEFHPSGAITFPLLGTKAAAEDKLLFDPGREKRLAIYPLVKEYFWDFNVFVGGTSSFDIVPKPYDKYMALKGYAEGHGIAESEILFIGDGFDTGGNDEPIVRAGINCLRISDYRRFPEQIAALLGNS